MGGGEGVTPIIGVTREAQVKEAAAALNVALSEAEMSALENAADASGVDTEAAWEKMQDAPVQGDDLGIAGRFKHACVCAGEAADNVSSPENCG